MRIGLIADIHGNKLALDTVLAQLDHRAVDSIVCLGDVAMLGPQPAESIATLQALQIPVVMGNTDAWFLAAISPDRKQHCSPTGVGIRFLSKAATMSGHSRRRLTLNSKIGSCSSLAMRRHVTLTKSSPPELPVQTS